MEEKSSKNKEKLDTLRNSLDESQRKMLESKWTFFFDHEKKTLLKDVIESLDCDKAAKEI